MKTAKAAQEPPPTEPASEEPDVVVVQPSYIDSGKAALDVAAAPAAGDADDKLVDVCFSP